MIDERKEELAALYALGALDHAETAAFETEMRSDAELRKFVDELTRHSAALAHSVPLKPAPEHLKERILERIREESRKTGNITRFPSRGAAWIPWALAAGLAIFCGLLFSERSKLKGEIAELRQGKDVCEMEVSMLGMMNGQKQRGMAVVVWDSSTQTGVLKGEDMPRPAANEDYQLWVMDPKNPQPVNAGVFSVDENGKAVAMFKPDQRVSDSGKFAVSVEPKGGVPQHDKGPIIMISK